MNLRNKIKNLIIGLGLLIVAVNPVFVYAQQTGNNTSPSQQSSSAAGLPTYNAGVDQSIQDYLCTPTGDGQDLVRCINRLYRFTLSAGALILVFFVVLAGYMYITGGESGKTKGKQMLTNSATGFVILLFSYVLLYFINPSLVVIKSIQPPIFETGDLPTCEEVGLGEDCFIVDSSGSKTKITSSGGYADCPDGVIAFDKSISVNKGQDTEQICKALMEKLKLINAKHPIIVTATIDPTGEEHDSQCHKKNNPKSGVCADMAPKDGNYSKLCDVINSVGLLVIVNESGGSESSCGKARVFGKTSGAHLHIYLTNGGGSAGVTAGGSRPYCRPIHKFLCDHPANDSGRAGNHVWTSSFPEVQKNLDELKKVCGAEKDPTKCMGYPINQVYRSPEYGAHMRSIFEAYAILFEGWSDDKISHYGQYCDGNIRYVKSSDLKGVTKDSEIGRYIKSHFNGGEKHFSSINSPTTCLSNHGLGIGLDFNLNAANVPENKVVGQGKLCHNIPKGTNGIASGDTPHYILYSKKKSNEKCTFP